MSITPRRVSLDRLLAILNKGEISDLLGVMETEQIDFKRDPYIMNGVGKKNDQFEIAKDIASIANSGQGGGIILIGVEEDQKGGSSCAKAIHPVEKSLVNEESWRSNINNGLYPHQPEGFVEFREFIMEGVGITGILIKETPPNSFPLLAVKLDGSEIEYFLVPYRPGARTAALLKREEIHRYLQKGLHEVAVPPENYDLARIENKIDSIILRLPSQGVLTEDSATADRESLIKYAESTIDTSEGFFYIHAVPEEEINLPKFFDKDSNKVFELLRKPPRLRDMGWDLSMSTSNGEIPAFVKGWWESRNGNRKLVIVKESLETLVACSISGFLDWGADRYYTSERYEGILINNFALVEFVDRFVALEQELVSVLEKPPKVRLEIGFSLPEGLNINLVRPPHLGVYFNSIVGPQVDTRFQLTINLEEEKETHYIAGEIMQALYAHCFGDTGEPLAYLGKDNKGWYVEEQRYIKLK